MIPRINYDPKFIKFMNGTIKEIEDEDAQRIKLIGPMKAVEIMKDLYYLDYQILFLKFKRNALKSALKHLNKKFDLKL